MSRYKNNGGSVAISRQLVKFTLHLLIISLVVFSLMFSLSACNDTDNAGDTVNTPIIEPSPQEPETPANPVSPVEDDEDDNGDEDEMSDEEYRALCLEKLSERVEFIITNKNPNISNIRVKFLNLKNGLVGVNLIQNTSEKFYMCYTNLGDLTGFTYAQLLDKFETFTISNTSIYDNLSALISSATYETFVDYIKDKLNELGLEDVTIFNIGRFELQTSPALKASVMIIESGGFYYSVPLKISTPSTTQENIVNDFIYNTDVQCNIEYNSYLREEFIYF